MPEDWGPRYKQQGRMNIMYSVQDENMLPFFFLQEQCHNIHCWSVL